MNLMNAQAALDAIIEQAQRAKAELLPDVPTTRLVRAGESLQAALDTTATIETEPGALFEGSYQVPSDRRLTFGAGSGIRGVTGPALTILPMTANVTVFGGDLQSAASEVVLIGNNVNQTRLEDQPSAIRFTATRIPTHRGKRGFGIHGSDVTLKDCEVLDCWSPSGQDSQAVYIGNAQGQIVITGGRYSAGSNVILLGGDAVRTPGLVPTDVTVQDAELFRPLSWQTDGLKRKVKNIFEVKSGRKVALLRSKLSGCWVDGQGGEAIVLTPALDGSKTTPVSTSGIVENVTIMLCAIRNVGGILNILGRGYQAYTPTPLTRVQLLNNVCLVSRATYGGTGQFAKIGAEPGDLLFEENVILADGSSLIYFYRGSVIEADGTVRAGGNLGRLTFVRNISTRGSYGFNLDGVVNAGAAGRLAVTALDVSGNTFGPGAGAMVANLPGNTYLTQADFDALPQVVAARA